MDGVVAVFCNNKIKNMKVNPMYPAFKVKNKDGSDMVDTFRNILAEGKVRYVGEPVLAIIGKTIEIAEEAADFVQIDYEEILSTTNLKSAIETKAPIVREELSNNICFDWELGNLHNTEKALQNSHHIT